MQDFTKLHRLLDLAEVLDASVELTVHRVSLLEATQWVQDGLLDSIKRGAPGNPPTGLFERRTEEGHLVRATVFTDGPKREVS